MLRLSGGPARIAVRDMRRPTPFHDPVTIPAPAKINLGLRILRKRPDGFHDLETVFLRIGWADEIRMETAAELSMTCSAPNLPVDGSNLCMRAVQAVLDEIPGEQRPGLRLHLLKNLPFGAGMGGGSSDAAVCLSAANRLLDAGLAAAQLHSLAASLGSDVPFFLLEGGVALGTGRGEILEPLPFPAALQETWLVVAVPPVHISTAEAYTGIRPDASGEGTVRTLVSDGTLAEWQESLINDFEQHLFDAHPRLAALKAGLLEAGAGYAAMSGSGSAVFGVFMHHDDALRAIQALDENIRAWVGPSDGGVRM